MTFPNPLYMVGTAYAGERQQSPKQVEVLEGTANMPNNNKKAASTTANANQLQIEEVRGPDFKPDTRLVWSCEGCGEGVLVHSAQGYRWLSDKLCTHCFKACLKWGAGLGDLATADKRVGNTNFRKSKRWQGVIEGWKAVASPLAQAREELP